MVMKIFKGKGLGILFGQFLFLPFLEDVLSGTTQHTFI
jgi:hypothetical protein